MGRIYGQASRVVAWLGPEADDGDLALKVLQPTKVDEDDEDDEKEEDGECFVPIPTTEQEMIALTSLFNRAYFERMWIIQQISLAQEVTIHCGILSADLRAARAFYSVVVHICLESDCEDNSHEDHETDLLDGVEDLWKQYEGEIEQSLMVKFFSPPLGRFGLSVEKGLLDLLVRFQSSQCSDPRDRVFEILSVADDLKNSEIVADYSQSVDEVYRNVIQFAGFRGGLADPVRFSQMLQQSLRAYRNLHKEDRQKSKESGENLPDAGPPSVSARLCRPWFKFTTPNGGQVYLLGPAFDKRHFIGKFKLPSATISEIEDVEPFTELPKAIL